MGITEGIIGVANHKLRIEGIESYKEYLAVKWLRTDDEEIFYGICEACRKPAKVQTADDFIGGMEEPEGDE